MAILPSSAKCILNLLEFRTMAFLGQTKEKDFHELGYGFLSRMISMWVEGI